MKRISTLAAAALLALTFSAAAHDMKSDTFQVTGNVTAVDDATVTVMKGKERFHISRDAATKVTGDLKVGAKVTVEYRMYAAAVTVKDEKAAAPKKK